MKARLSTALALLLAFAPRAIRAQDTVYTPVHTMPDGREIVTVYIGAESCGPCHSPEVKHAVRAMKPLVAAQARARHAAFAAIGVANDWEIGKAEAFLSPLDQYDQVVLGGNWTNLALERFVWRDPQGVPAMPQILVFERTVTPGARVVFSDAKLLRRVLGEKDIPAWVAQGAPIVLADSTRR